jgi:outer membrane biosynthesis protein TonB
MASMATYFDKLEKHTDLEVSIIRSTKINKVLKMIVKLNAIPRDEEFNFRQRAMHILSSWKNVLDAETTPGPADKSDKPTANGSKEDDGADTPKLETEEEKETETKSAKDDVDSPMPDADAEKAPEPEKEAADIEKPAEESTKKTEQPAETEEKPAEEPTAEKAAEAAA